MHPKTLFKSFNNKITTTGKKRDKEQIPKRNKKIGNNISDIIVCSNKMENYKEQYTKKKETKN